MMKKMLYDGKFPLDNLNVSKVIFILAVVGCSILGSILLVEFVLF
ncbi:hypothetical protein [Flavobacterium sp.]|nr:hypothetical protein [Flavobacterium sp.]